MPVTVSEPPVDLNSPRLKTWTREECEMMQNVGVDLRQYELIEGELIQKVSKNHPHIAALVRIRKWFRAFLEEEFVLSEAPIFVSAKDNARSEPEPDVVILGRSILEISNQPRPSDILLVVEISDSTLRFDLTRKAGLYARANIQEYWVLDLKGRRVIVHRDPAEGQYRSVLAYGEDELLSCLAAPERQILVSDLL